MYEKYAMGHTVSEVHMHLMYFCACGIEVSCVKKTPSFLLFALSEKASVAGSSGWVPLLLALLYEYTSPRSHWRPYLSLWTDFRALDQPMFW